MSIRELERKHRVTWRTVRKALDSSWPEPRKKLPPRATVLDPCKPVIDEILLADLDAPRKQRHTVTRIFHRLIEEHGADVYYGVVLYYIAIRKPEILTEREEKNSVAIASNESFDGWTKIFTDPRLCAAIVDRSPSTAPSSRPAPTPTALPPPAPAPKRPGSPADLSGGHTPPHRRSTRRRDGRPRWQPMRWASRTLSRSAGHR